MAEFLLNDKVGAVVLTSRNPLIISDPITVSSSTGILKVRIQRPTTAVPLNWGETDLLKLAILLMVDEVEYSSSAIIPGGIIKKADGTDGDYAEMTYFLPQVFSDAARTYIQSQEKDAEGYYRNIPLTRVAEMGVTIRARLSVELIQGNRIETVLQSASAIEIEQPILDRYKNSVAFDARTSNMFTGGSTAISLSHTATGSDRAAYAGGSFYGTVDASSCTYGGTSMTELFDLTNGTNNCAGYILAAPSTGSQTVTMNLSASSTDRILGVLTFTGVDQTTPNGNQQTGTGTATSSTLTCTSVNSDDMVVDTVTRTWNGTEALTVGANQNATTQGWTHRAEWNGLDGGGSTQAGVDGGVMSWSWTTSLSYAHGAVVIKAANAAASSLIYGKHPMANLLVR